MQEELFQRRGDLPVVDAAKREKETARFFSNAKGDSR